MGNPLMLSLYAEVLKSPGTEIVVNMFDLYSKFVEAKYKRHEEKEEAELASMKVQLRVVNTLAHNLKFYFACAVEELVGSVVGSTLGKRKAAYLRGASLKRPIGNNLVELINYGVLVSDGGSGCRFLHRSFAEFFYAKLLTHEENEYKKLRAVLFGKMYEHKVALNVESFVREILLKRREEPKGIKSPKSFPRSYLRVEEAALYFGKERLQRLANGWINTLWKKGEGVKRLLLKLRKSNYSTFRSSYLCSPVKEVRGELVGADDKKRALDRFFNGNLFPFLCGSSVLMSLDYSEPGIFESMKYYTKAILVFLEWMCALGDQSWVRANVFGIEEDCVAQGWKCPAESAELILMFAVRSDRICEFFPAKCEISAALNSLDSVVKVAWRVEDVEVGRVRWTLKKYVDPQRLKDSLLIHLRTVDDFLSRFFVAEEYHVERVENNFEWSWWYAEVFSRKEIRSFVTEEASRVSNIHRIGWRALKDAWGEEFALPREPVCKLISPTHEGKTLLDIKEGDLEFVTFLLDEVERGGLKLEGELMEVLREMIFGDECGWQVLEKLERRLFRQRPAETNANNCSFQEPNILEQLFKFEEVYTAMLDSLQAKLNSCKVPPDMLEWHHRARELTNLWEWLPFVVRYSGDTEPGKLIIERFSLLIKYGILANLSSLLQTQKCAARSFVLARSGSSSLLQLIRSFLRGLETEPESLLKLLLEAEEGELRTLIKENSPGPLHTVSHTPIGPSLTSLLTKSTSAGSTSTLPLGLTMESPWNAESVAFIFTELIDTSPCYELPGALKQFHSSFHLDLIKQALLCQQVHQCFRSKSSVFFRKYRFVNTERLCSLRAAIRFYFVVFREDLRWIVSEQADVDLLLSLPVEILSVLEYEEETVLGGFPPLPIEVRLSLVRQIEEHLRKKTNAFRLDRLDGLVRESSSYHTEADWKRLFQAQGWIPRETCPVGYSSTLLDHNHKYKNIVESRLLLIRVWMKYFGEEKTRRTADEQNVWGLLRDRQKVPRGEYLHLAVELGSLEGVKTLAWPGLLKWKNPSGKSAREVAVGLWGAQHEISRFLEERFQAVKAFHDEQ